MRWPLVLVLVASCRGSAGERSIDQPVALPPALGDNPAPIAAPSHAASPFALVELFTSEGCSSCPRADVVLAELHAERVFPLTFHVAYWNSLGWRDRFSSGEMTARQNEYAATFGRTGVYTPQMIVNGVEEFTGSDRARATRAIARALESE